jgi:hypothetical protein
MSQQNLGKPPEILGTPLLTMYKTTHHLWSLKSYDLVL